MGQFEQAQFGDGSASGSGNVTTTVSQQYGPRTSGHPNGRVKTEGLSQELVIAFDYADMTAGELELLNPIIPARSRVTKVVMINKTANVTSSAILDVGTDGSEATNGFTISDAQLDAAVDTVVDLTGALSGTWDAEAPLAAATTVNIALLSGTITAGSYEVVISYDLEPT